MDTMIRDEHFWAEAPIYALHYDVHGMFSLAEAALHYDGTDLYNYVAPKSGASLKKIVDGYLRMAFPLERTGTDDGKIRLATFGDGSTDCYITGRLHDTFLDDSFKAVMEVAYKRYRDEGYAWVLSLDPDRGRVLLLSPAGRRLDQQLAKNLAAEPWLVLICGRYEGVDERVVEGLPAEEISIGDYVLSGGEVPALVLLEAVTRLIPGVVGRTESIGQDSFESGILDHPHYTRPREFRGMEVPEVLTSGDHAAIAEWRREAASRKTRQNRPDLLPDPEP
jgi:tRNA G37 N-methylase TrmD